MSALHARRGYVEWIEIATALLLVALVSMQLSLTVGSLALVSGYDGSRFDDHRTWSQTSFEWATQHCVSFFFAAALVGGRVEPRARGPVARLHWPRRTREHLHRRGGGSK